MRKLLASLLFVGACGMANADRIGPEVEVQRIAIASAPAKVRAPYDVQVIRQNGQTLPTHALRDRFYVQGNAGERYIIRVTNPTPNRVEAVVSVDGLDVVDGEAGDLNKRGYVVPPYGDVRIEGFRTSAADVATFRFSSVDDSYAGRKGAARNVGVIAVAIFEERVEQQQVIVGTTTSCDDCEYEYEDDLDVSSARGSDSVGAGAPSQKSVGGQTRNYRRPMPVQPAPPPPREEVTADGEADESYYQPPTEGGPPPTMRPGLGTEFGEQRYSAASWTKFVRAFERPIAIAELRYNDSAGLAALGIDADPLPDAGEIMTRETADPFPGDQRFSSPP
jgi:hypothetical protein